MKPAELLPAAAVDGITLTLVDGALRVRGPAPGVEKWGDAIRAGKADLVAYLTPWRLWLIRHADGRLISHSFTPAASRQEVEGWYPEALSAEPYQPSLDQPESPLSASEEARIRAWLASIGEEDEAAIEEVLENCRTDAEARDYFLGRASEASHEQS